MLPAAGLGASAGEAEIITTPTGAPSGGSLYRYAGDRVGVQWSNGDATSSSRVYYKQTENPTACPSSFPSDLTLKGTASPGQTTFETGDADSGELCSYYVVHYKGGTFSSWHQVTDSLDAGTCFACA